jgi:hypothetical protein
MQDYNHNNSMAIERHRAQNNKSVEEEKPQRLQQKKLPTDGMFISDEIDNVNIKLKQTLARAQGKLKDRHARN